MSDINTELTDGVLRVEMNRPEKKNAMTGAMYSRLAEVMNKADKNDDVRVVLWHGAGDSWTAGNDIADFQANPPAASGSPQGQLTEALIVFSKAIVVAVHGAAVGGGTTMLTHCDFVFATENTRFQIPFINLALTPEFGSSFLFPSRVGHLRAAELFMLGEPFSAAHAAEIGLVTRVVPDVDLLASATAVARKLAAKPAGALRTHKKLLKAQFTDQLRKAVEAEGQQFAERVRSPEAKEAFSAFFEKRPPNFTNLKPAPERTAA